MRGLRAGYGPVEVLHGIDLDVDAGEVVVILGANGAGKTTTMRAVSGTILRRGTIMFDGSARSPRHRPTRSSASASPRCRRVGARSRS